MSPKNGGKMTKSKNDLNNVRIILESDMHLGRFMQISLSQISSRTREEPPNLKPNLFHLGFCIICWSNFVL